MGATLSLCWFTPDRMYFAHVGDSRIYYLPKGEEIRQLTHDHTHVGHLVRQGKISEFEAKTRPDRNILNQALGGNIQQLDPQIGSVDYFLGDRFAMYGWCYRRYIQPPNKHTHRFSTCQFIKS